MAFGPVNYPGVDGAEFEETKERSVDANYGLRLHMLGDAQEKKQINDHLGLLDSEALGEYHEVTLTNAKKLPFNSTAQSPVSVALTQVRKNLFYTVETTVLEHTGMVGEVEIQDKARNGFKLRFTGSGSSVKVGVRVKGGMA